MKRLFVLRFLVLGVVLALLALGCSGGSGSPLAPDPSDEDTRLAGTISLGTPVENGDELAIPIEFSDAEDLYGLSFRLAFVQDALSPVAVDWSGVVEQEDATFHMLNRRGFVPLAFTRYNGLRGLRGSGTLCTVRFRIRTQSRSRPWLIADDAYLVAYNSLGQRLRLRVGGEAQ